MVMHIFFCHGFQDEGRYPAVNKSTPEPKELSVKRS